MFIINLKYKVEIETINQFIGGHRSWLDELYATNKLLCSGPKYPRNGGVIIALVSSLEELKELLSNDPFFINDLAEYEIIEFHPNKLHPKFEKLMML